MGRGWGGELVSLLPSIMFPSNNISQPSAPLFLHSFSPFDFLFFFFYYHYIYLIFFLNFVLFCFVFFVFNLILRSEPELPGSNWSRCRCELSFRFVFLARFNLGLWGYNIDSDVSDGRQCQQCGPPLLHFVQPGEKFQTGSLSFSLSLSLSLFLSLTKVKKNGNTAHDPMTGTPENQPESTGQNNAPRNNTGGRNRYPPSELITAFNLSEINSTR